MNYTLKLNEAEAEIVRTALLEYSDFAYYRANECAQKSTKRRDGQAYTVADVRAAQDAARRAEVIRSKIMPAVDLDPYDAANDQGMKSPNEPEIIPPGLPPLPLPRFHGTRPEQGSFCAHQLIDYANEAVAAEKQLSAAISRDCNNTALERNALCDKLDATEKRLKTLQAELERVQACAKRWMERSDANYERAQVADSYRKMHEHVQQRLVHAEKVKDNLLNTLIGIHALLAPPELIVDGKTYRFKNPMAAEVLHELSNRIRAIPGVIAETKL